MSIILSSADKINKAAKEFVKLMGDCSIFAFYGKIGAGKTTFIKAICLELGVKEEVTSPSFSIINEYRSETTGDLIYHFDFYRIKKNEEIFDLGYEEYFYSGAICLIEWPELIEEQLPNGTKKISIDEITDGKRIITIED